DGIRDFHVTGVQTCALPISPAQSMMPIKGGEGGMAGGKFEESSDRVANVYHRPKNGIPGRRGLEDGVGEHAAVPADVLDPAGLSSEERRVGKTHSALRSHNR